jgi:regulator of protease activity HflC (stomatin/prohibitin superfamily)
MFDKLIDFIIEFIDQILPVVIIKEYDKGAFFRFGKYKKIIGPGLHFKIPFIDSIDNHTVVTTTMTLPAQSVVTKDGISVVIKAQIKYEIEDLSVFAVKVYDAIDAISDMTCGIIFQNIKNKTYQEACTSDLNKLITSGAKREAKQWGINIEKITVTDFSQMRSIRLFNEGSNLR